MNVANLQQTSGDFHLLETTGRTQTATMTLGPGEASSDEPEQHPHSDQVLLLLRGELRAEVGEERQTLRVNDTIIVPAAMPHRFVNEGKEPAFAFTVYGPPAYQTDDPT